VDEAGALTGIFTDGDLRRALDKGVDVHGTKVRTVMTASPRCIEADRLAAEAVQVMESMRINGLLVTDAGKLAGALNMHDLLQAKIV
jgi:arabinose-5-phosphate isomerase